MGILDRLETLVRSNINALRDDEHGQTYRDTLVEMNVTLREARERVARVMDDERDLEKQLDAGRREEEIWEKRAMHALRGGDEAKAKQHLGERHRVARQNQMILQELAERRAYIKDLMRGLEALETKIDAMRAKAGVEPKRLEHRPAPKPVPRREHTPVAAPSPERRPYRPHQPIDDDVRRWEEMMRRRTPIASTEPGKRTPSSDADTSFGRAQESIDRTSQTFDATFDAVESKIEALEADVEATWQIGPEPGPRRDDVFSDAILDENDPLYDPKLADLERRFRDLERGGKR